MRAPNMLRFRGSYDAAMLLIRVGAGLLMAFHGWSKIRSPGVAAGFQPFYESLGLPLPSVMAYVVTYLEFLGGIMIIAGLLTRVPALLLCIEMLFTGLLVKLTKLDGVGFTTSEAPGVAPAEVDLLFFVAFAAVVLMGPGRYALDAILGIERGEAEAGPSEARAGAARRVA